MDWFVRHGAIVLIFIGGAAATIGAFFAERRADSQTTRRHKGVWPMVILAGAIIGVIGTYWGGYQQDRIAEYLSGGDSFGYLSLGFETSKSIEYVFVQHGDVPLYDTLINVHDITKANKMRAEKNLPLWFSWEPSQISPKAEDVIKIDAETNTAITVGNVNPGEIRRVWTAPVPQSDEQRYSVSIWARNGFIKQELLLHRVGRGWTEAMRVWRVSPSNDQSRQLLHEFISRDFPKDKLDWR